MNRPELLHGSRDAEACCTAALRASDRLLRAIGDDQGVLRELIRLLRDDAAALERRAHAIRRRVEMAALEGGQ